MWCIVVNNKLGFSPYVVLWLMYIQAINVHTSTGITVIDLGPFELAILLYKFYALRSMYYSRDSDNSVYCQMCTTVGLKSKRTGKMVIYVDSDRLVEYVLPSIG